MTRPAGLGIDRAERGGEDDGVVPLAGAAEKVEGDAVRISRLVEIVLLPGHAAEVAARDAGGETIADAVMDGDRLRELGARFLESASSLIHARDDRENERLGPPISGRSEEIEGELGEARGVFVATEAEARLGDLGAGDALAADVAGIAQAHERVLAVAESFGGAAAPEERAGVGERPIPRERVVAELFDDPPRLVESLAGVVFT